MWVWVSFPEQVACGESQQGRPSAFRETPVGAEGLEMSTVWKCFLAVHAQEFPEHKLGLPKAAGGPHHPSEAGI